MSTVTHKHHVPPLREGQTLWRADEAAKYLGFKPSTMQRKARHGEIPYYDVFGEQRWTRELLDHWLQTHCLVRVRDAEPGPAER